MKKKAIALTLLLILTGVTACTQSQPNPQDQPAFTFTETEFDFGTIKQSGGKVTHDFPFTYTGPTPIEVLSTPASCLCTEATINKTQFQPGEQGTLTITFNPNLHAEPPGRFFKTATIITDPPISPAPEVKIWAQIDLDLGEEAFELKGPHDDDDHDDDDIH